jgi:PKD repeat protein
MSIGHELGLLRIIFFVQINKPRIMRAMLLKKQNALGLLAVLFCAQLAYGTTNKYRLTVRDDPSTTVVIGWNQLTGTNPVVYYGTVDHGTNYAAYPFNKLVDKSVSYKGMNNRFARLSGLTPNTIYYFVIQDSDGTSSRFSFRTLPDVPTEKLSIIAGGDSRNNRTPRQAANSLVAKLRPHAVMFGGDYTNGNTNVEWDEWFEDWQLTIGADGRMTQLIATRGNHESSNLDVVELFDVPSAEVYYAITLGGSLLRVYTLNTETAITGNQTTWLTNDLAANQNVSWRFAQYHRPMRPHTSSKAEGNTWYSAWSSLFQTHKVKLVVECDAHTVKTTWPVVPSSGTGSDEGFIRDDVNGTVFVGEGCWGAPLRTNDDDKAWTRNSGMFNNFNWIHVEQGKVDVRKIKVDNANLVGANTDATRFLDPANLDVWTPSNGSTVTITNAVANLSPTVSLTSPTDGAVYTTPQQIALQASAADADGSIQSVEFYQNGNLIGSDATAPYSINWTIPSTGAYTLQAIAIDNDNAATSSSTVSITCGTTFSIAKRISAGSDDVEEGVSGTVYNNSTDLELVYDSYNSQGDQLVGLRFTNLSIPQGAFITSAYIQFTCDEASSASTSLTIRGEASDNSAAFTTANFNVSSRSTTSSNIAWLPPAWSTVGQASAAQRTPDISALVAEIVSRPGWTSGNSLSLIVIGTGARIAEAYEGSSTLAPELVINYSTQAPNQVPLVSILSPANNAVYSTLAALAIDVAASDADGTIDRVELLVNGAVHAIANTTPYQFTWTFPAFGAYTIMAVAYDDDGALSSTTISVEAIAPNQLPVAAFAPVAPVGNAPLTIFFDAAASTDPDGTIANYAWDFGDGSSGTGITPWHTYYAAGNYTVTLIVTDNLGATNSISTNILVYPPNVAPTASFTTSATSGLAPLVVSFNAASSMDGDGTITNYAWDFGDGTTASGPSSTHLVQTHTYSAVGIYTAQLTVTDNYGATGTLSVLISSIGLNQAPVAVVSANPISGTAPLNVAFMGGASSDADGNIVSYAWDFGDGGSAFGITPSHIYTSPGSYNATLTVTDNQGATGIATVAIAVAAPNVSPFASFAATPNSGLAPLLVSVNAAASSDPDGSIVSYAWNFGDGNTATGVTASNTYASFGNYLITLTVTDNNGATATATQTVSAQSASPLEYGSLAAVNGTWQTVTLAKTYANMVVVATPVYVSNTVNPVVTRIRNASGNSFQIRVQRPNNSSSIGNYAVQYVVAEEGTYTEALHGIKMEAKRFTSSSTSYKNRFTREVRGYNQTYTTPVVLGQVMTYNDADWSVFWSSRYNNSGSVPTGGYNGYNASKHVGEDSDRSRSNETLGLIVIEAGTGTLGATNYATGYTNDFVRGPGNSSIGYSFSIPVVATHAVVSGAAMDDQNGYWPVFAGANGPTGSSIAVWADEDQISDTDRSHSTEQVAYLAFGAAVAAKTSQDEPAVQQNALASQLQGYAYPNPTTNLVNVVVENAEQTDMIVEVVDLYGKVLIKEHIAMLEDATITIDLAQLPAGNYMVRLQSGVLTGFVKVSKVN